MTLGEHYAKVETIDDLRSLGCSARLHGVKGGQSAQIIRNGDVLVVTARLLEVYPN